MYAKHNFVTIEFFQVCQVDLFVFLHGNFKGIQTDQSGCTQIGKKTLNYLFKCRIFLLHLSSDVAQYR